MSKPDPFYSEIVRKLAEILNETNLTEIEYAVNECKIRVARQLPSVIQAPVAMQQHTTHPASVSADLPVSVAVESVDLGKHPGAVKAPMVGMAYMSASPESSAYVALGDRVAQGQTLMIIEAMKVMNQIKAPKDGIIKQILCKDGDPIEYDQILVIIE